MAANTDWLEMARIQCGCMYQREHIWRLEEIIHIWYSLVWYSWSPIIHSILTHNITTQSLPNRKLSSFHKIMRDCCKYRYLSLVQKNILYMLWLRPIIWPNWYIVPAVFPDASDFCLELLQQRGVSFCIQTSPSDFCTTHCTNPLLREMLNPNLLYTKCK